MMEFFYGWRAGIMNKKITITRWILTLDELGQIDIVFKEVSRFAPLNRLLDVPGFYALDFFDIDDDRYFYTFEASERDINKSMVHVGKIYKDYLLDMTKEDLVNLSKMKEIFFTSKKTKLH